MTYQQPATPGYRPPPQGDWNPPPRRRVHPLVWVTLVIAVSALGAAGYLLFGRPTVKVNVEPSINGTPLASIAAAQDALPSCKALFVPDKIIDNVKAKNGCKSQSGQVQILGYMDCGNGKTLYPVDARTGAPVGWGYGGEKFHAVKGEIAADAGYGQAYHACNG